MNYNIIEPYPSVVSVNNINYVIRENTIENKIEDIIGYCQLIINDKHLFDEFEFNSEQLNIHKQYITNKLSYLNKILEYKIKNEIRYKYNVLKNVFCEIEIDYIVNLELVKNRHVIISREMLFIMNSSN